MKIIISPAKKMRVDEDSLPWRDLPCFLGRAEELLAKLRTMTTGELKALWKCSDKLVEQNVDRLSAMDLTQHLTPAILSYEGIQYQYMAPGVFTSEALEYVQEHLRILSGFYGVVRPFDGVTPYRLEMQAKLNICEAKDLYSYWGDLISEEIYRETDCVVNLASKEYSLCLSKHLPEGKRLLTCAFVERKGEKLIEKGTLCKMARGEMVRFMAENRVEQPVELQKFTGLGYCFSPEHSNETTYTFIKEEENNAGSRNEST